MIVHKNLWKLRPYGRGLLDVFIPPRCLGCSTVVETQGTLCTSCWTGIRFIEDPLCQKCGVPFEYEMEEGSLCGSCLEAPPTYDKARSLMVYEGVGRDLILTLKHGDGTYLAPHLAKWMTRIVTDSHDLIVPVPLHWTRLLRRSYNQAALMSKALSRVMGIPSCPDVLTRQRRTRSQGELTQRGRLDNVKGAFRMHPKYLLTLKGKSILLMDDVLTTGATLEECSRVLKKAGARSISILTLARATR